MNRLSAYARLVRLPNVFTAAADISVGVVAGHVPKSTAAFLFGASASFYCAGMALNDYFDRNVDAIERPQRPIPRGVVSAIAACGLALALSISGFVCADVCGLTCFFHAFILAILIFAYNIGLKSTIAGPFVMGGCRFTNILLGFSTTAIDIADWPTRIGAAAIVGIYIVGVTMFSRNEAGKSRRETLAIAAGVSLAAVLATALIPATGSSLHPYLIAALALLLFAKAARAYDDPLPRHVQSFVKSAIFGLIVLDSALAVALAGPIGLCVLLWLIPAVILGRWLYST